MRAMLTGAVIAGCLAAVDGAILGLLFGSDGATLRWGLNAALGGAAFGAIAGLLVSRLVLKPPEQK